MALKLSCQLVRNFRNWNAFLPISASWSSRMVIIDPKSDRSKPLKEKIKH